MCTLEIKWREDLAPFFILFCGIFFAIWLRRLSGFLEGTRQARGYCGWEYKYKRTDMCETFLKDV